MSAINHQKDQEGKEAIVPVASINELIERYGVDGIAPTNEAAGSINRSPQTLRKWSCLDCAPNGIRPIRINGRLAWRIADLQKLLDGSVA